MLELPQGRGICLRLNAICFRLLHAAPTDSHLIKLDLSNIVREIHPEFLTRSGGVLLSHALRRSTIGATVLNGRVRDGIGCFTRAMATKPRKKPWGARCAEAHPTFKSSAVYAFEIRRVRFSAPTRKGLASTGSNQAYRAISTGQLNALLRLHLRPIDVVVCHGPQGYLVSRGASRLDAFSGYPFRS